MDNSKHAKISPTAWATAHARTFTDILYSKEFFDMLEAKRLELGQQDLSIKMKDTSITLLIEGRYKMIDKILKETNAKQVLELASGLTQRGFIMTNDPEVIYVEMDLPGIMDEKREMIGKLEVAGNVKRPNLHIEGGNALDLEDFQKAVRYFNSDSPVAIINEGLLRYLNFEEKASVARNVKTILEKFGGIWITPDVSLKRFAIRDTQERKQFNASVQTATGVDIEKNLFRNKQHAKDFFTEIGFDVEERPYSEIKDQLSCVKRLNISEEEVESAAKNAIVLVMRPKKA